MDTSVISIALFLFLTMLISCRNRLSEQHTETGIKKDSVSISPSADSIFKKVSKQRFFSSKDHKDIFELQLQGSGILSSNVIFTISNKELGIIYTQAFDARDLIGYNYEPNDSITNGEQSYILERMDAFFSDENFKRPAIPLEENYSSEDFQVDREYWAQMKRDAVIGFFYVLSEEDMRWIAFDKKQQKVIVYKTCC